MVSRLDVAIENLRIAFSELNEVWDETLDKDCPFHKSFDELAHDVNEWALNQKED